MEQLRPYTPWTIERTQRGDRFKSYKSHKACYQDQIVKTSLLQEQKDSQGLINSGQIPCR